MRCIHLPAALLSILYAKEIDFATKKIICLPGQPGRRAVIRSYPVERVRLMSTYEELMVILTVAMLIVAILNHRK